ncbi:MAG: hypothetical protein HXS44_02580 [Theionarchaea archaeon]|nr:hypothetical protein [Theionarchaea archaeon]
MEPLFEPGSDFTPKAAQTIETTFFNEDGRGTFYLLRNPENQRYIKVHERALTLFKKMDGTRTIAELQAESSVKVKEFVYALARGGFLEGIDQQKRKESFYTIKVPLFKGTSRPLIHLYKRFFWLRTTPFKVFYILFVGSGFLLFLLHFKDIFHYALFNFDITEPMMPLTISVIIFYIIEFAHEFAHTGTSYYYGAKPGNVGIAFYFLVVFFYVETPDTRILSERGNLMTFLAGPLTSLFAAEVCTFLFLFTDPAPAVWGGNAFFWHVSVLITLIPFMETDGYYIVQHKLKFPNLFRHALAYLRTSLFRLFNSITKEEYENALKGYTKKESRILKIFAFMIPMEVGILIFIFFIMALNIKMIQVIQLAPVILFTDHPYGIKGYVLLISYCFTAAVMICMAALTGYRFLKRDRMHP